MKPPFRLELTVGVLRRLPAHPVEVWTEDGRYLRAFETPAGPVAWSVSQPEPGRLDLRLHGPAGAPGPWRTRVRRALGLDAEVAVFHARAALLPALAPVARALRGLRPPRFQALHEAIASVVPYQQVSLAAGMAVLRRVVLALSVPVEVEGVALHPFPSAGALAAAPDGVLRAAGLSAAKVRTLRGACEAIASGALDEAELEALPTEALLDRLRELPGIGPWSAALVALRGFGRLDVFPPGDAAAPKLLASLGLADPVAALGPSRGMLYYGLFVARGLGRLAPASPSARRGNPSRLHRR